MEKTRMTSRREFLDAALAGAAGMALLQAVPAHAAKASDLTAVLKAAGKKTYTAELPDGTKVLMLPYGGRVLGVFAPGSDENFYWTNSALETEEKAKAFFASKDWQNTGGDRTWIAPEVDVFLPDFPRTDKYWQPRALDPGNYKTRESQYGVQMFNRLELELARSKKSIHLEIRKAVGPAPNPLRYERGIDMAGIEYAGYTQYTSLVQLDSGKEAGPVGLWNLVQMPHGGDMVIPTYFRSEPTICFGEIAPADLEVSDRLIRYHMRAKGEHKITIRAAATAGRIGYVCPVGGRWALIVRNFTVNPSGEYVDPPWKEPDHLGYSTQACNVNSALGAFSELEYHIPAIGGATGLNRCDDAAQVWAYRGTREQIKNVAAHLLTPEL